MQLFANKNGKVSVPFNVPYVALFFARKKKLQETYGFLIDSDKIFRSSKQGKMEVLWSDIKSIDETAKKFFFNLSNGSMLLPKSKLSDEQLELLNESILAYTHNHSRCMFQWELN